MTLERGEVGLADLAHALRLLAPRDAHTLSELARHVGMQLAPAALARYLDGTGPSAVGGAETASTGVSVYDTTAHVQAAAEEPSRAPDFGAPVLRPLAAAKREEIGVASDDSDLPGSKVVAEGGSAESPVDALPAAPASKVPWTAVRRPVPPLLRPLWAAGVLARMASTREPLGDINVHPLVELISRLELPRALPRMRVSTLMRGAQVLIDLGPGMEPFAADQRHIVQQLRRVVGGDRLTLVQFRCAPLRAAGSGPAWTWTDYQPPEPGMPVLALTDLGTGAVPDEPALAAPGEWLELAELLQRRGSALVALVPYPPRRWPRALIGPIQVVEWSGATGVQAVGAHGGQRGT